MEVDVATHAETQTSTEPNAPQQPEGSTEAQAHHSPLQGIEREQLFIQRSVCTPDTRPTPTEKRVPILSIAPAPGIVRAETLHDKIHVLTQDADGEVRVWDVLRGREEESFGKVDFRSKADEIQQNLPTILPPWFQLATQTGRLLVSLSYPTCFHAVAFPRDLEEYTVLAPPPNGSQRIVLGEAVLDGLFARALGRRASTSRLKLEFAPDTTLFQTQPLPPSNVGCTAVCTVSSLGSAPENVEVVLVPWIRRFVFDGETLSATLLPVTRVLLIDSRCPERMKHRLRVTCNSFARTIDLADVLIKKFGIPLPEGASPDAVVSFQCRDKAIPPTMNVETIKQLIWNSAADIEMLYAITSATKSKKHA